MEDADLLTRYYRDECSLDDVIQYYRSGNDVEHLAAQSKDPRRRTTVLYVLYEIGKAAGDQWRVGFSWISDANPDTAYLALGLISAHGSRLTPEEMIYLLSATHVGEPRLAARLFSMIVVQSEDFLKQLFSASLARNVQPSIAVACAILAHSSDMTAGLIRRFMEAGDSLINLAVHVVIARQHRSDASLRKTLPPMIEEDLSIIEDLPTKREISNVPDLQKSSLERKI